MKKDFNKTAVDFLFKMYHDNNGELYAEHFNHASQLEKNQIIKAHIDGFDHIVVDFKKQEYAEQYYNQTYNQNDYQKNF
jgi:hypothetical protein